MLVAGARLNRKRYRVARAEENRIHRSKKRKNEERVIVEAQENMDIKDMRGYLATVYGARHKAAPMPISERKFVDKQNNGGSQVEGEFRKFVVW